MVLFAARSMCISREVGKMPLRPDSINATQRKTAVVVVAKVPEQNGPTPGSPAHGYASPNLQPVSPNPSVCLQKKSSRATLAHSMSKSCPPPPSSAGGAICRGIREEKGQNGARDDKTERNSPNATKLRRGIPFLRING